MTFHQTFASLPSPPFSLKLSILYARLAYIVSRMTDGTLGSCRPLEQEFTELIRSEATTISQICFYYSGSIAQYDDLRQNALINIWRGMKSYRGQASLHTWVYRVTINSCLTTLRSLSRHNHESLDQLYDIVSDESDKDTIEHLHTLISRLSLINRAIIMMWLDDMTYDEIAIATGMKRNTIATRLRRIKEQLTSQFDNI